MKRPEPLAVTHAKALIFATADAIAVERRACAEAVCWICRGEAAAFSVKPWRSPGVWMHPSVGNQDGLPCHASAIYERGL